MNTFKICKCIFFIHLKGCIFCIHFRKQKMLTSNTAIIMTTDKVRKHPGTGMPSAVDVIQVLIKVKNGRQTWNAVKKRAPDIIQHITSVKAKKGFIDYVSKKGFSTLVADLRTNKTQGQEMLRLLRTQATEIARRFWEGDPSLAHDLIDRIDDPTQLEHIVQRAQSKLTQRMLTDTIKAKGGTKCYAIVNDRNNVAITGKTAQEIKKVRGQKRGALTRDLFDIEELVNLQYLELKEHNAIKRLKGRGNEAIFQAQHRVLASFDRMNQELEADFGNQ